jgi:uncharacterized protein
MTMSKEEVARIQEAYTEFLYDEDVDEPIDLISYRAADGDSLLHIAALRADEATLVSLLDAGMDVNIQGDLGYTPLHYAAENKDLITLFLRYGARTDIKNEFGDTPDISD